MVDDTKAQTAYDPETGKTYDVQDPSRPVEVVQEAPPEAPITRVEAVALAPPSPDKVEGERTGVVVVGASPTTGEVAVLDTSTGERYWKPATPEQIARVEEAVSRIPEDSTVRMPEMVYQPPEGVGLKRPLPGSLAAPLAEGAETARIFDHRGAAIDVPVSELSRIYQSRGIEQYQAMIEAGILPTGKFVQGAGEEWGYIPEARIREQARQARQTRSIEDWLQDQVSTGQAKNRADAERQLAEIYSGQYVVDGIPTTKAAYDAITARRIAEEALSKAGFVSELPKGVYMRAAGPPLRTYTIPSLAEFVRKNPDGMMILRDAGFKDDVLSDVSQWNKSTGEIASYLDKGLAPTGRGLSSGLGLSSGELSALGRAIDSLGFKPVAGGYEEAYRQLNDDQKRAVAVLFDKDWTKGSAFSALAADIEHISSKNLALQLLTTPIQPIMTPVGKLLTLKEAKEQLSKEYATALSTLKEYVKPDGTFDIKQYEQDVKANPSTAAKIAKGAGYEKPDDVKSSMEYYNYATTVTPKEWAAAALVGALDVLMLGGAGALASLGVGGRIAGQVLSFGTPISLGAIQAPDVVRMMGSPNYSAGEKTIAVLGEAAMFSPLAGAAIRGTQFLRTIPRPDYVPARSLIVEASTPRAVFSPSQVAKLTKAGATRADFIQLSNEIEKAMTTGAKSVTVNFKGVPVRVKNIAYQTATGGGARFTGVPDITLFTRGEGVPVPLIKQFYSSFKVALEPIRRSYNEGRLATKPGIVEVRIADPELAGTLMTQKRGGWKTAKGGYELELEGVLPSLDELRGQGYELIPILGKAGKGVTFDTELGPIEIRRFTLAKVVDNPTGLVRVKVGGRGDGGIVGVGDLHNTSKYRAVYNDINSSFHEPFLKGDPDNPNTWQHAPSNSKGRTVWSLGDNVDRGTSMQQLAKAKGSKWYKALPDSEKVVYENKMLEQEFNHYKMWRDMWNRVRREAQARGDNVERTIGNHELAYLVDDEIRGIISNNRIRALYKSTIADDVLSGDVKAVLAGEGKLGVHAGISKGVFPELSMRKLESLNKYLKSAGDLMRKTCNI